MVRILVSTLQSSSRGFGTHLPGVIGGHVRDGPASPWSSREFQEPESVCDVRRGSAFLCQLASTDQRRPLQSRLSLHWPMLERCGDELIYRSPLPESCPCVPAHAPFRGTDAEERFVSSSSKSLGTEFWKVCLADLRTDGLLSLGDGGSIPSENGDYTFFLSLRLRTPEHRFTLTGWLGLSRGLCSAISVALDRLRTSSPVCVFLRNRGGRFSRRPLV